MVLHVQFSVPEVPPEDQLGKVHSSPTTAGGVNPGESGAHSYSAVQQSSMPLHFAATGPNRHHLNCSERSVQSYRAPGWADQRGEKVLMTHDGQKVLGWQPCMGHNYTDHVYIGHN